MSCQHRDIRPFPAEAIIESGRTVAVPGQCLMCGARVLVGRDGRIDLLHGGARAESGITSPVASVA